MFFLVAEYMPPTTAPTSAGTTQPSASLVNGRLPMKPNGRPNPFRTESRLVANAV